MPGWAVVTGCRGPVGRSLVSRLQGAGFHVLGTDHLHGQDGDPVPAVASGATEFQYLAMDLSSPAAIEVGIASIISQIPSITVLVNNAAITNSLKRSAAERSVAEEFSLAFQVNAIAPYLLSIGLMPLLEQSSLPSIVNVASIYGLVGPVPSLYSQTSMGVSPSYAASKGALVQITRYLATVMAPRVRVNAVAPGGIAREQPTIFAERYEERTPLGRMGSESDVAGAVRWLAGSDSRYVTGQIIAVDGGWTAW